jgi:sortase (surface protein transpeptidase)
VRRLTRRRALLLAGAVLAVVGALLLVVGLSGDRGIAAAQPVADRPAAETTGAPEPTATAAAPTTPEARYTPASDTRLVVPSVGIDLPLLGMSPDDGHIDPEMLTAGYWIDSYGAPVGTAAEAENTLYVAAHSAGRGDDGFDPLISADGEGSTLAAGDVVEVRTPTGTVPYTVTGTHRYGKEELPGAEEIWEVAPGRLVLITCFQRADGREATENLVVVAEAAAA